ncbi:MAG: hypothetical protein L0Y71_18470 [Gemmataceae bacterium]|nr:hypothetical protein [Gemmataceae bacterium]
MLSERALQLLTAYVDGELSSRQRKLVMRLLHKSAEARQFLKDLQQDQRRLHELPVRKLDTAFAAEVVRAIEIQPAAPTPTTVPLRRWPAWTRYAVAAAVLLALSAGLWLSNRQPTPVDLIIADNKKPAPPEQKVPGKHDALVASVVEGAASGFLEPVPPARAGMKLDFDELAKTQWHEHIVGGMAKQQAVHLDVAVTNQRQAVRRLETVLQNKGIRVVVDPPARAKLGAVHPRTEFVIYAENIRPDELAAMLYELGTDERARTSIEALTLSAVTEDDRKQLSGLLGIKAEELRDPPVQQQPLGTFIPKKDKAPATAQANPVRAGAEARVAMVLANASRTGALSSELKYFLHQRRQLQPGALQVIVIVHQA